MKKKKISKLLGHRDQVVCLYQHEGNLISGSHDHTIRIWDLNSEICIKVIRQELTASGIYPDIEGIILHSNGYLYLFTSNNISKMNANTYTIEDTYQITYTSRLVALKHKQRSLVELPNSGLLFIGGYTGEMNKQLAYDICGNPQYIMENIHIGHNNTTIISTLSQSRLAIGCYSKGLLFVTDAHAHLLIKEFLLGGSRGTVLGICEVVPDLLFVALHQGITMIDFNTHRLSLYSSINHLRILIINR